MVVENKKYTIKDVSKEIKVSIGSLKKWEKDFGEFVYVHRTKNGSRIYQEIDLITLKKIKLMKEKNLSNDIIKFILKTNDVSEEIRSEYDLKYDDIVSLQTETIGFVQNISDTVAQLKEEFMKDAKQSNEELKSDVRKELIKGDTTLEAVQNISNSFEQLKEEFMKDARQSNEALKSEVKKELIKGDSTLEAVQNISNSFEQLKEEFMKDARQSNEALKSEVKKELIKGDSTLEAVQNISNSFEQLKEEFMKDARQSNEALKSEVKKELIKGDTTLEAVQNISNSFEQLKEEFMKDARQSNEALKSEVRKELIKGNSKTEGLVQTYSEEVLDNYKMTYKKIKALQEEIEKEQEEKIFLQKKVEEREELFKEFVQSYREAAAANEQKKEKFKLSYWLNLLVGTK